MPASSIFLQVDNLMLGRFKIYCVEDPVDNVAPVAGEQRRDIDVTLLQSLFGIELIERAPELPVGRIVTRHLRAMKASAQTFKLLVDLAPASFQRIGQRGIDFAQLHS